MQSAVRATPLAARQDVRVSSARRLFDYARLFRVDIRHEYYGRRSGSGLFTAAPTDRTTARVHALGLIFRGERDGFSVLYDVAQSWRARAAAEQQDEPLSFEVLCASPHFVSITDVDLDTSPRTTPFRFSNRPPGDRASPAAASSGRNDAQTGLDAPILLRAEVRPAPASSAGLIQVSSPISPIPIAIIDIFTGAADRGGPCPLPPVDGPYEAPAVSYEALFAARRTFWRYHVVPQAGSGPLDNLAIDAAMFLGPFEETLVNGERGHRFLSKTPLALASQSATRWSLHGRRRERMTRDAMLVERLPVPSVDQLGLLTADERELLGVTGGVCSEMFVYV